MKPWKAYSNILKLRLNLAFHREVVNNYPICAYIDPTLYCNLRCPACPTGLQLGLRPASTLKWELYKSVIDEIGDYVFCLMMYNWGEPLLHKQTPELISYAKTKKIEVRLSSNLSLKLSDDYLERLVKSGLDRLIVSVDGVTEETYSKYRRRGNLAQVRENMLRIQAIKQKLGLATPIIDWQFLVFKHNQHELEYVSNHYREWGADSFYFHGAQMPYDEFNTGFEPSDIPIYNVYHPDHFYAKKVDDLRHKNQACSWLYGTLVLNPNGKVSPCCAVAEETNDFGDYLPSEGFKQIWNSPRFRQARRMFPLELLPRRKNTASSYEMLRGTASIVNLDSTKDELICNKCPIPYLQDDVLRIVNLVAVDYWKLLWQTKNQHYLLALLFMGLPGIGDGLVKPLRQRLVNIFNYPKKLQKLEIEYQALKTEYDNARQYAIHVETAYQKLLAHVSELEAKNS